MGKRSNFERREADFYPTPRAAVAPLIPHLRGIRSFAEPCAGDGALIRHLESFGLRCAYSGDIRSVGDRKPGDHKSDDKPNARAPLVRESRTMRAFVLYYWRDYRRAGFGARCQQEGVDLPRKHLPRKKIPSDLRSLARGHTELCVKVLAGLVSQEAVPAAARVSAAGILLDRGWGKAIQPHTGEDSGNICVTIRQIIDSAEESEPLLIEHEPDRGSR
jgi:hypothetical protein